MRAATDPVVIVCRLCSMGKVLFLSSINIVDSGAGGLGFITSQRSRDLCQPGPELVQELLLWTSWLQVNEDCIKLETLSQI